MGWAEWIIILLLLTWVVWEAIYGYNYSRQYATREKWDGVFKEKHKTLLEILKHIAYAADKSNVKYWLHGGTLLAAMRHGQLMEWDDDVDVGMLIPHSKFEPEIFKEFVETTWAKFVECVHEKKDLMYILPDRNPERCHMVRVISAKDPSICADIIFYRLQQHPLYPQVKEDIIQWQSWWCSRLTNEWYFNTRLFPLTPFELGGTRFMIPNDPFNFLDRAYPGWQTSIYVQVPHTHCSVPMATPWALFASKLIGNYGLTEDERMRVQKLREEFQRLRRIIKSG